MATKEQIEAAMRSALWTPAETIGHKYIQNNFCDHYNNDPRDSDGKMCTSCYEEVKREYIKMPKEHFETLVNTVKELYYAKNT